MKTGLTTSVILHATLLGFGLFSLSAPKAFDVGDVEALPVEIVSITQLQQGDKKAPMSEKPAPTPTKKPDVVPDAKKIGENKVDTDKPATPDPTPKEVKTAAVPKPSPEPTPKPIEQPKPEPVKQPEPKPTPVPATEVTPEPQPKREVKPDPVAETIVAENAEAEAVKLPENAPSPESRPQPPKAETAKAPDRKDSEKPAEKQASKPKSEEKEFNADEVAALLNKDKASGGGAKRSTEQAALGSENPSNASKLSQSEMDALRGQVQRCWIIPAGAADAENLRVSVQFKLDRSGALEGSPEIISGGGSNGIERAAAEAARRAVARCAPYNLPANKYDAWADVIVNFDPSEMF
jgi:outer membrane biosynthesis protein TonB